MKRPTHTLWILYLSLGLMGVFPAFGQTLFTTAIHYDTCYDDSSPKTTGHEITIPLGVAYKGEYFSLSVDTAYSSASVEIDHVIAANLASFTDTLLSATYTYTFPTRPLNLILGVDVNLPTGKKRLSAEQEIAEWGKNNDLFKVDDFGEGFNVGLSLGLMRQFKKEVIAIQGTYIFNGEYDPTSEVPDDNLDPGDQILVLGLLDYQVSSWLDLGMVVSYSYFFPDQTNGQKSFRQGDQLGLGSDISITSGAIEFSGSVQSTFPGKSEKIFEGTLLQEEAQNSNGIGVFGTTAFTYTVSEKFGVHLQGDVRYYGESALKDEQTGLPYSGRRLRYELGPGFSYFPNEHLSCNGMFKFFTMAQAREMFTADKINLRGMNVDIGLTYTF